MTFSTKTTVRSGRKSHRCDYCGNTIPAGWPIVKIAGVYEGDFHSARGHIDCNALWNEAYPFGGYWGDAYPFDLCEVLAADETREIVQAEYDLWRGQYPHVICRLELRWQRGDMAGQDRARVRGKEPDYEDYPEIYG